MANFARSHCISLRFGLCNFYNSSVCLSFMSPYIHLYLHTHLCITLFSIHLFVYLTLSSFIYTFSFIYLSTMYLHVFSSPIFDFISIRTNFFLHLFYYILMHYFIYINVLYIYNRYVRLNRDRLKGSLGELESFSGLNVLFEVLLTMSQIMSPFTPFFAEYLYQNLRKLLPLYGNADKSVPDDMPGK